MATPLITTKLHIPPIRPSFVTRQRLIEQLDAGIRLGRKLTLISALTSFGRATLVSEWIQAMRGATPPIAVAWFSLDESDNNPPTSGLNLSML